MIPKLNLCVKLDIVSRKQSRCPLVVSEPPVIVRELETGDFGPLGEAQLCIVRLAHI
jgi:hypothetical protein